MTLVVDTLEPETLIAQQTAVKPRWRPSTRLAFRFFAVYFTCYVLLTQMFNGLFKLPGVSLPSPEDSRIVRAVVTWVATKILGLSGPFVIDGSGSGDKPYDYAFVVTLLVVAAVVTAVWSFAD